MGIAVVDGSAALEVRRLLFSSVQRRKDGTDKMKRRLLLESDGDRHVCVTSGVTYLGTAIAKQLLSRGYSVRIIADKEEDVEKLREMVSSGEMRRADSGAIEIAMAKLSDVDSLVEAFDGCCGVFHTAAFVDPSGLSGYSKAMAGIEVEACENVIKACGMSQSVVQCVLTSSLLTCIWQDVEHDDDAPLLIDHKSWSNESLCIAKKLWYALGKLRAEKAAMEIAKRSRLNLATVCGGLITGRDFIQRNPTATIAYLKGTNEMYRRGLLAINDVDLLAKAHIVVFEEMKRSPSGSGGRYIWFDRVIESEEAMHRLEMETGLNLTETIPSSSSSHNNPGVFQLSRSRLLQLLVRRPQRCMQQSRYLQNTVL